MDIKKENIATTGRPAEYIGTIAIDTVTAGKSIEQLINKLIKSLIDNGYHFNGLKIYTGHPYGLNSKKSNSVDILFSKYNHDDKTQHDLIVEREINLFEIIASLKAISIQLTSKLEF